MTISSLTTVSGPYGGDGTDTTFDDTFKVYDQVHLDATLAPVLDDWLAVKTKHPKP